MASNSKTVICSLSKPAIASSQATDADGRSFLSYTVRTFRRRKINTPSSVPSSNAGQIAPTIVFDTYWRFAAERLAMYHRRNRGDNEPWTHDTILEKYRFTNVYRATDRVSQYLIREVQYNPERSQDLNEVFFRTMLFKLFNKIETWESLEKVNGPLSWSNTDLS
ncbi:MAG: hypothetical protein EOO61_08855, partial [Hymenobacter sp.]